jgi:tight adherence protein B
MTIGIAVVIIAFIGAFLGVFTINMVIVDIFQRDRKETLARLNQELMNQQKLRAKESVKTRSKNSEFEEILSRASSETRERKGVIQRLDESIAQSGLNVTRSTVLLRAAVFALVSGLLAYLVTRNLIASGAIGGLLAAIPLLYISHVRRRRMDALLAQLPDALELMSRVLRAGQSITQGIRSVADEFSPPISMEFGYCYEQQNLGLSPEVALHELSQRTGLLEMRIFVLAMLVHKQSGGNLTAMLDSIARVVRERFKMRVEIKSLTAEGRLQAIALLAMPVVLWIGLFFLVRDYAMKLFDHPPLVMATLFGMILGAAWIRKIVNFDF